MKRYGNLWDKICDIENLRAAHHFARKDKLYYKEVRMVDKDPDKYLFRIQKMLKDKSYKITPLDYAVSIINDKGKERELWKLPYYPHRIIQWAVMLQVEKIFMQVFCYHTCASIVNRGTKQVIKLMNKYLKNPENAQYCLKLDIKKFYPNINHKQLKRLLRKKFKDKTLLEFLDMVIDSFPTEKGVPIGSYLSQFLANFYLAYFDHWLKEDMKIKQVIRYMDDIVIIHKSKEFLHLLRAKISEYLHNELIVELKANWQIFPVNVRGIDFVGFRFFFNYTLLRKNICKRLKKRMLDIKEKRYFAIPINFQDWSAANSYIGWLKWCDSWRLYDKYIKPITNSILYYYGKRILKGNLSLREWYKRFIRFKHKLDEKHYKIAA